MSAMQRIAAKPPADVRFGSLTDIAATDIAATDMAACPINIGFTPKIEIGSDRLRDRNSGNFTMFAAIRPRRIAQRPPPLPDEREGKGCGSGQREIAKQQKSDQSR